MTNVDYCWQQAMTCACLAQVTDDQDLARTLRDMATDFVVKAEEEDRRSFAEEKGLKTPPVEAYHS